MTKAQTSRRLWALQLQQPLPAATVFDRIAFLFGAAAAVWLAAIILIQGVGSPWVAVWLVPVWAITAYLVLPRLHRLLSDFYLPEYFFGRTRTADGLLGDPVNLAMDGSAAQLDQVMTAAGWHRADEVTLASTWGIVVSTLARRSYPTAPVSPLMLFGRRHDVAYQQEADGNPRQRHHVRFWHCPPGWLLPGGAKADWLAAATYDRDIGISFFTLQVTHRIDQNTDVERDYVVSSARSADSAVRVRVLRDFTAGYHARNGGGDRFVTDGDLPVVDVTAVDVPARGDSGETSRSAAGAATAGEMAARVPMSTVVAVSVVLVGVVVQLLDLFGGADVRQLADGTAAGSGAVVAALAIFGAFAIAQLVMAWLVLRGGRRSRAVLIVLLTVGILTMALDYLDGSTVLGLDWTLLTASVQCVALLALSSESSGAWARRRSRTGVRLSG